MKSNSELPTVYDCCWRCLYWIPNPIQLITVVRKICLTTPHFSFKYSNIFCSNIHVFGLYLKHCLKCVSCQSPQAELALLREALKDPSNVKFVMVAHDAIPLYPPYVIWAQLMSQGDLSHVGNQKDPKDHWRKA